MKDRLKVCELPGVCWPNAYYGDLQIDRGGQLVRDYLLELGLEWGAKIHDADIILRKAELTQYSLQTIENETRAREAIKDRPVLDLIGEPRELAPMAYMFAKPQTSLTVSPGREFNRMHFCAQWRDPELDNWHKREDKFCWVGRPIENRIRAAQALINQGVPLDIYSREPWPVSAWRGPAPDDVEVGKKYKYRIVFENSTQALYHSEKVFRSLQGGSVTFYMADPALDISFLEGSVIPFDVTAIQNRNELAPKIIEGMNKFIFTEAWEVYSPREFYKRIYDQAVTTVNHTRKASKCSQSA